jgi:hypothetical protein
VWELKLLFNMTLGYMYQFLDEMDMWSLVEKIPKRLECLNNIIQRYVYESKKNSKNHVFLNWNSEYIVGYLIHLNKNKTK